MTPQQRAALESLHGAPFTAEQATTVQGHLAAGNLGAIAALMSVGRTRVAPRMTTARGLAELMPGGPMAAEAVLLKLEGARDSMLASADQNTRVTGSLLRRQLGFLAGDGLDFGSNALRGMLDQFAATGVLTAAEAANLKSIALAPNTVTWQQVYAALQGV